MASVKRKKKEKIPWRALFRGIMWGLIAAVVSILLLTMMLYLGWLKESAIAIGNTIIKILASLAAGIAVARGKQPGTWIVGGVAAAATQLLTWTGMSLYLGAFTPTWNLLADLLMSFAVGAAAAALIRKLTERSGT